MLLTSGDVTDHVTVKTFDDLRYLVLSCTTTVRYQLKMIVSGTLLCIIPDLSASIFKVKVIQGHSVKERSK